jgi:hypothetical protein
VDVQKNEPQQAVYIKVYVQPKMSPSRDLKIFSVQVKLGKVRLG